MPGNTQRRYIDSVISFGTLIFSIRLIAVEGTSSRNVEALGI